MKTKLSQLEYKTILNEAIKECLFGPATEPDSSHLTTAAYLFKLAESLNIEIENLECIIDQLRGENEFGEDFIEYVKEHIDFIKREYES